MAKNQKKQGFEPLVCGKPKILVLGTLPGDKSLENCEYYKNKSNRFWKVVAGLLDKDSVPDDYDAKKELLESTHIALWDVYKNAVRKDSLDVNIKAAEVNNFDEILKLMQENSDIEKIVFNGKRPSKVFSEKYQNKLKAALKDRSVVFCQLSSTSGASGEKTDDLIAEWKKELIGL